MSPRDTALAWIAAHEKRFSDFCGRIWEHAEPAWREYKSAADYVELLRAEGFAVEAGSGGMPTAFVATWGQGAPVLAGFSEYDAVPGNSQQVVPYPAPRACPNGNRKNDQDRGWNGNCPWFCDLTLQADIKEYKNSKFNSSWAYRRPSELNTQPVRGREQARLVG